MKKTKKKIIMLMIFGGLIIGGWQANLLWEQLKPVLAELEEKDPEKYKKMVEEVKSFHVKEAKNLYREIETMTSEAVIILRYEKWRKKKKDDKKFHEEYYNEELLSRIEVRKAFQIDYQSRIDEIQRLKQRQPVKARFDHWKKTEPWKQRLILREKCVKYVKMEIKDRDVFRKDLEISKVSTLVAQLSNEPLPVELLCNDLVPVTQSSNKIQKMVLGLKKILKFKYYAQLLEEIGIPKKEIFLFKDEISSKVRDYNDF
jgi:hypothetical protein